MENSNKTTGSMDKLLQGAERFLVLFCEAIKPFIDIVQQHKDGIYKAVGEFAVALKPILAAIKLGDAQYVYWEYLDSKFVDLLIESKKIDELLIELNERDQFQAVRQTISSCNDHALFKRHRRLFTQTIIAYNEENYDLSAVGLFAIIDGILTDVSEDPTTKIFKRAELVIKRIDDNELLNDDEIATIVLSITFSKTIELLSANHCFSKEEPPVLNRHWIMHGRSCRLITKLDCIKTYQLHLRHPVDQQLLRAKSGKQCTIARRRCVNTPGYADGCPY